MSYRVPRPKASAPVVGLVFVLLAAACGSEDSDAPAQTSSGYDSAADTTATNGGVDNPVDSSADSSVESDAGGSEPVTASIVLPAVSGSQIDFGSVAGTDTVLWFWAPW